MSLKIVLLIFLIFLGSDNASTAAGESNLTHVDVKAYFVNLTELYSSNSISVRDFIPVQRTENTMHVNLSVELYALNDFDEVSGSLELMMGFNMTWYDEIVFCNGLDMPDAFQLPLNTLPRLKTLLVPHGTIWTPNLILMNSVESIESIGGNAFRQRFNLETGEVQWNPRVQVHSACSPDVTYYPFDRQKCTFTFSALGNTGHELYLGPYRNEWGISSYEENGEWTLIETNTESAGAFTDSEPTITLSITIERKPLYFAFNIILPILVLVLLNGMVFWLPVESGERVGFSVTCFLSFVVLLNMIMDILPRSSSPISYLCFYTVSMMMFSGLNTAFVILQMKLFHKPDSEKVPQFIVKCIWFLKCECITERTDSCSCTKGRRKIHTAEDNKDIETTIKIKVEPKDESNIETEITWRDVAQFLDKFFFLAFLSGQIFFSLCFLLPVGSRA